ncbi:hypothetical protein BC943DRAFT_100559 [Umbelopsis sp. AD052]|nr:hypothetical protein BC943DRAFT_100559 [Umbelopsis sp. AD052]
MLTNYSKKKLSSLFEQAEPTSYAFSDRLASCFNSEAVLSPRPAYIDEWNDDLTSPDTNPPITQYLKPRKRRLLDFNNPYNTTQASQDTSGFTGIDSQKMEVTLDEDEVMIDIQPILQGLQSIDVSSTQTSQSGLAEPLLFALLNLPHHQMTIAFKHLDFSTWDDDRMAAVCDVISKHPELSHQNTVYCLKNTVFVKIQDMKSVPPRSFMTAIIQMAKLNGGTAIDGIVLHALYSIQPNKALSSIILKLISGGLSWDNCSKLLSIMVADPDTSMSSQSQIAPMPWTPLTSNTVAALLHIKPPLDLTQVIVRNIISGVRIGLEDDSKENSHIQLLLVLVTKHGERIYLDNTIIDRIEETANMSDSFLKKSIQNQIKSLKRKVQPFAETQG